MGQLYRRGGLLALLSLAAWMVGSGIAIGVLAYAATPPGDQWDHLAPYQLAGRLFDAHNEHRIILPQLIFRLDLWLARDTGRLSTTFVYLFEVAQIGVLLALARWTWPNAATERLVAAGASSAILLFSGFQWENFASGFQVCFPGVFLFGSAALGALAKASDDRGGRRNAFLAIAALSALAAAGTMANGLILLVLIPVMALLMRMWISAGAFSLLAAIVTALYLKDFPGSQGAGAGLLRAPVHTVLDFLAYLGGAPANAFYLGLPGEAPKLLVARLFGFAALSGLAFLALPWLRRPLERPDPKRLMWVFIGGFVALSAMVTAAGRQNFGELAMLANRYGAATSLLWSILAIWLAMTVRGRLRIAAAACLTFGIAVVMSYSQTGWLSFARGVRERKLEAEAALLVRADAPNIYLSIFPPDAKRLPTVAASLRRDRLAMFSEPWQRLAGAKLAPSPTAESCPAALVSAARLQGSAHLTWKAALAGKMPPSVRAIAAVSQAGEVEGLFIRGLAGDAAKRPLWSGYAQLNRASDGQAMAGFGVDAAGHTVCRLDASIDLDFNTTAPLIAFGEVNAKIPNTRIESLSGGFVENGQHPTVGAAPGGARAWGSWSGSGASAGRIKMIVPVDKIARIALPIVTGADTKDVHLEVQALGRRLLRLDLSQPYLRWTLLAIDPPAGAREIEIVAEGATGSPAGWIAIAEPFDACGQSCAAPSISCPSGAEIAAATRPGPGGWVDRIEPADGGWTIKGWAADIAAKSRSSEVVLLSHGETLTCLDPKEPRADVAKSLGAAAFERSGFTVTIPEDGLNDLALFSRGSEGDFVRLSLPTKIAELERVSAAASSRRSARQKLDRRLKDLQLIKRALEAYAAAHHGTFPVANGWNGYASAWGPSLGRNWIPGLAPEFVSVLPRDPDQSDRGDGPQYLYASNGADYKLLAHFTSDCAADVEQNGAGIRIDPRRLKPNGAGCNAYGYWTAGGVDF